MTPWGCHDYLDAVVLTDMSRRAVGPSWSSIEAVSMNGDREDETPVGPPPVASAPPSASSPVAAPVAPSRPPPRDRTAGSTRSRVVPAVVVTVLEILLAVLSNQVTTAGWTVVIAFGGVAVLLVAAVALSVVHPEWRNPGSVLRHVIRGRWGPAVVLTSVTWIVLSVVLFGMRGSPGPPPEPGRSPTTSPAVSGSATATTRGDVLFDDFAVGSIWFTPGTGLRSLMRARRSRSRSTSGPGNCIWRSLRPTVRTG